jgi:hypothetical protein
MTQIDANKRRKVDRNHCESILFYLRPSASSADRVFIIEVDRRGKVRAVDHEHPTSATVHQAPGRKNLSEEFRFLGKIDLYSLAPHCRICQREVFSKVLRRIRRLCTSGFRLNYLEATSLNFALTIGMLKLRRRLRSTRPNRRPTMTWEVLHIPVAPCLSGWRDHIRR